MSKALAPHVAETEDPVPRSTKEETVGALLNEWLDHAAPSFSPQTVATCPIYIDNPTLRAIGSEGRWYNTCVLKATIDSAAGASPAAGHVDRFDEVLQTVARSITQVRLHERLLRLSGIRLDRSGATLLFKLAAQGDALRVTDLAEILGVDTPTVTRKVQQLERDGMVVRQSDPDDGRASRIRLSPAGRRTIERVRRARRTWLEALLQEWDDDDLSALTDLLSRFGADLERDLDDDRD